jgi:DNA invertase Pin-like site-specific DNA recombinase
MQEELTLRYCQSLNAPSLSFTERPSSGALPPWERPELVKALAEIKEGRCSGVVVTDLSRFQRPKKLSDLEYVLDILSSSNATIIVVGRDPRDRPKIYDPQDESADWYELVHSLLDAKRERETIVRRMMGGRRKAETEGRILGPGLPFWIEMRVSLEGTRVKKEYVIREPHASAVRWIYDNYDPRTRGRNQLAADLNEHPEFSKLIGRAWAGYDIGRILKNPRAAGLEQARRSNNRRDWQGPGKTAGEIVPSASIPAVITPAQWWQVQGLLQAHPKSTVKPPEAKRYPLAGLLRCAVCGGEMWASSSHGVPSYRCRANFESNSQGLRHQNIRQCHAHTLALEACKIVLSALTERPRWSDSATPSGELDLELKLIEVQAQLERLDDLYLAGGRDQAWLDSRRRPLVQQQLNLQAQLGALRLPAREISGLDAWPALLDAVATADELAFACETFLQKLTLASDNPRSGVYRIAQIVAADGRII